MSRQPKEKSRAVEDIKKFPVSEFFPNPLCVFVFVLCMLLYSQLKDSIILPGGDNMIFAISALPLRVSI